MFLVVLLANNMPLAASILARKEEAATPAPSLASYIAVSTESTHNTMDTAWGWDSKNTLLADESCGDTIAGYQLVRGRWPGSLTYVQGFSCQASTTALGPCTRDCFNAVKAAQVANINGLFMHHTTPSYHLYHECAYYSDPIGDPPTATFESHQTVTSFVPCGAAAGGDSQAVGDPHLQNMMGEKFDLMTPGWHVLVQIPRATSDSGLLRVTASAKTMGGACSEMYFQEVNVTGAWAFAKKANGYYFNANQSDGGYKAAWVRFGSVDVKVAFGRTGHGDRYINFYVKHLNGVGHRVGGLLGEDDHASEAAVPAQCKMTIALRKSSNSAEASEAEVI